MSSWPNIISKDHTLQTLSLSALLKLSLSLCSIKTNKEFCISKNNKDVTNKNVSFLNANTAKLKQTVNVTKIAFIFIIES